jgi:hypothetical protein
MHNSPLFNYAWFLDHATSIKDLAALSMADSWDYTNTPTGRQPILSNYIHHTFAKIQEESKVIEVSGSSIFNTGLVTSNQEEIFGFFETNKKPGSQINWFFKGWRKKSDKELMRFTSLPEVANYFENPADLLYDTRLELRTNIDHIINDNFDRFPETLKAIGDYQLNIILQGTIDDATRRVKRNYKTAIPQFYKGKLQLLLPLCLQSKSIADLALVVEKENDTYRATTCLTLDMALNNARLIARPDDEWLKP